MLTIRLFGPPQLLFDGRPLGVARRRSRALIYYLAAHAEPITRDQLIGLLWPEHDRAAAQHLLRTTLHSLRQALGPALLVSDNTLALTDEAEVDLRRFEAQLSQPASDPARLAAALAFYRGDFLENFSLPDAAAFDEWMTVERERCHRLAVRGFTALAQSHEARREFHAALDALTRALTLDPLQEDLQSAAMRFHYLVGDRAGAIRRYESLRKLLDEELGVPPMKETRALYDAIITDALDPERRTTGVEPARPTVQRPDVLPFTGRAAELHPLRALAGSHKLIVIEGEPGIGKTRLAETFIRASDALNLTGAAHELEQSLPYQPMIEALRRLLSHPDWAALRARLDLSAVWLAEAARLLPELAESLPGQRGDTSAADESRLWEALNQLLLAVARQRPLTLFLDDLHWADASTLALLGYLIRQTANAPIIFLAAARPAAPRTPLAALLHALTREDRLHRLTLARLTSDDMTTLARQLSPTNAAPLADWLIKNSEGNPYILAELIRYARAHHLLLPDGELKPAALSSAPVVPQTVYSLIQSRLTRLSDAGRRVLDVAVAVGREFDVDVVVRAAGLSEPAALAALDELSLVGLIMPLDGLRYAFDHSLTMEVAYRELGDPRHRLLHRRAAEAIESLHRARLDSVAGLLASHFAEGNAPERAAPYAFQAGQQAAHLAAWVEAIAFYEQALAGADESQRAAILMALGEARTHAGLQAQATEAYRAALVFAQVHGDTAGAVSAAVALAGSLLDQARFAEVIALSQEALTTDDPVGAVQAEFLRGMALFLEGTDLAAAADHLQRAASLPAAQAHPALLAEIRLVLGNVAAERGNLPQAVALYRQALTAAEVTEAALLYRILAHNNLAYHLHLLGDPDAAAHAHSSMSLAREKGALVPQASLLSTLGEIALAQNDLTTAERCFTEGLGLAERLSIPESVAGFTAKLGLVAQGRGQTPLAIHRLSSSLTRADALGTRHLAAQIRLWLAPLLPPAEARAILVEARAIAESGGRRRLLDEAARLERLLPPA